jgi:hypothetical protein
MKLFLFLLPFIALIVIAWGLILGFFIWILSLLLDNDENEDK